jgi:hypothetical protein
MSLKISGEGPDVAKSIGVAAKWNAISAAAQMLGVLAFLAFCVHTCWGSP